MRNVKGGDGLRNENQANEKSNQDGHVDGAGPIEPERVVQDVLVNETKHS